MQDSRFDNAAREAERVCRESYGRLLAWLAAGNRDVASVEDALCDALMSALSTWPERGVPENAEAWILKAARRKLIDRSRRAATRRDSEPTLKAMIRELDSIDDGDAIPDERLKLMFVCSHPAIDPQIRTPLMLQTVLGIDAATIASAFLVAPKTMGQRLSRAKTKIREAGIGFRVPDVDELPERIGAVHEAVYAAFGLAWELSGNSQSRVADLCEEAIWLARIVVELLPENAESQGLLALLLHCHARRDARLGPGNEYVPLDEQPTERWSHKLIDESESILQAAATLRTPGPFQLEAAIQSAHAARRHTKTTNWNAIASLYDGLLLYGPTVGTKIARAICVAKCGRLQEAVEQLDNLDESTVAQHQPFWAARAFVCRELGQYDEAKRAYQRAIGLTTDRSQREYLVKVAAKI